MKVHLVHQSFSDYTAGLSRGLRPMVDLTVSSVIAAGNPGSEVVEPDELIRCRRFRDPLGPVAAYQAVNQLASTDADVVHWQAAGNPLVDLAAIRLARTRPFVLTIHDMRRHPGDSTALPGTFAAIRALALQADCVVVHADCVRRQVIQAGIAGDNVFVLAHGELGSIYPQVAETEPSEIAESSSPPTVLFFGRVQPYKGLNILLDAMELVRQVVPHARLVVAGAGRAKDRRLSTAKPPWVDHHPGFIAAEHVRPLFAGADVVALPYVESSQSGVAALALGFGRPVVASAVGGLIEVLDRGRDGRLVPPNNPAALALALVDVLSCPDEQRRLSARAKMASRTRLGWFSIARQTILLYHQAVTNRADRQRCQKAVTA